MNVGRTIGKNALCAALCALIATAAGGARAEENDESECFQEDRAYVAMNACSRLLMSGTLDAAKKVRIYERRGRAALVLFYFSEAAEDFTNVLAAEPDNTSILAARGEALSEDGLFSKAAEDWARVAALKPDSLAALLQLGKNLYAAGSYEQATGAYEKAIGIDAKNIPALVGLSRALDMSSQPQKSDETLAEALKLNPENTTALNARAEIAERRGNVALAVESYKLSLKANGMQIKPRQALQRLGVETPP